MSRKPLPEVRNSHRAARIERERAIKNYEQARKKQEDQPMKSSNVTPIQTDAQQPLKPRRSGRALPPKDRDIVMGEIAKRTVDGVADDVVSMSPGHTRNSARAFLTEMDRDPNHRFWSTTRNLIAALARRYRNEIPFEEAARSSAAVSQSRALAQVPQPSPIGNVSVETITTIVAAVMNAMGKQQAASAPQLPKARESVSDRSPTTLRRLATMLHKQWADSLMDDHPGFDRGHAFAAAWQISYDAYEKETGLSVQATAQAEQKASGRRTNGLDIIERNGDLARFIEIAETAWAA